MAAYKNKGVFSSVLSVLRLQKKTEREMIDSIAKEEAEEKCPGDGPNRCNRPATG